MAKGVIYTKVGENKGSLRVWLQGTKLSRAGFNPGDHYDLEKDGAYIRMVFRTDGQYKVSRRKRGEDYDPVIDSKARLIQETFSLDDRVRVVLKEGAIEITLHHQQRVQEVRERRMEAALRGERRLEMGSLAHGGGILDHALHQGLRDAGVETHLAFANEIDENYLDTSLRNNPVWSQDSIAILGPMQEVEFGHLPKIDLLAAGIPCTGASLSGRSKNGLKFAEQHETAGSLFTAFLTAVNVLRPSVVVLENVPPYQSTVSMYVIRSVLSELNYSIQETILSGADFGALEDRKRMCMVAISNGLPQPDIESIPKRPNPSQRLGDVLEILSETDDRWKSYDYLAEKEQRDLAAGKGFRRQILTPDASAVGTIGRGYNKARSTEPFLAHPTNPNLSRLLTPAEHARVKTIPEGLVAGVSATQAHEMLGQSVVHDAFRALGEWLGMGLQPQVQALAA